MERTNLDNFTKEMKILPLSPENLSDKVEIPDNVIFTINMLIYNNWAENKAQFSKKTLLNELIFRYKYSENEIIANNWLNFVGLYRAAGYEVKVDFPQPGTKGDVIYTFTKSR